MSEVRYRGQLRQMLIALIAEEGGWVVTANFIEPLLISTLLVPEQLKIVLEGDYEGIKSAAIYLVGALQIHALIPALIGLYDTASDNSPLQYMILSVIKSGQLKHAAKYGFLLARMQDTRLSDIPRMLAMSGIESGKYPDAIAPLLAIAHNMRESALLRGHAIGILGHQLKDDQSRVQALLPLLKDDDSTMRSFALQSLSVLGDASLASYVEPLLTDTTPASIAPTVGEHARQVLEKWASAEEEKPDNSV